MEIQDRLQSIVGILQTYQVKPGDIREIIREIENCINEGIISLFEDTVKDIVEGNLFQGEDLLVAMTRKSESRISRLEI